MYLHEFTTYRRDRNISGGGILPFVRDEISLSILSIDESVGLYIEIKIRKKEMVYWMFIEPT